MITECFFENRDALFDALATDCTQRLSTALDARARASLLVSGGATPTPLFERLSRAELPWASVAIGLVDERWVDESDVLSNARLVRETLVQHAARAARFIGLKTPDAHAAEAQATCHQRYAQELPRPYDLVLLGMGKDGHTASLFPGATGLSAALDPDCPALVAALAVPDPAQASGVAERMSLSLNSLLSARQLVLLILGEDKQQVYEQAKLPGPSEELPVRAVLQQTRVPVAVYWAP